ncbi:hypothetical protein [Paenibacillus silviterrae]|uniref:hypothetical protein n=1 Tax=Paenibacillus silviterrae TaxID=3242194 RepID=UPI002543623B|nr:hypothetical protein [Paenibacillus chinjuensis]
MLLDAYRRLPMFPLLALIPLTVDGISVLLGMLLRGFHGNPHVTFKLTLQMGLPSIAAVTEQTFMLGSVQVGSGIHAGSMLGVLLLLAAFLTVQAFLQGGYIGLLHDAAGGSGLSLERFAAYGRHFFGRFFLLNLLVMALLFLVGGIFTGVMGMPGVILFMLIFISVRIVFLYLEFTLVVEDCSIGEAFPRSLEAFRRRTSYTLPLVAVALVINVVAGLLINAMWMPFLFFVLLVAYDLTMAGLQLAFMEDYHSTRRQY